jgi:hypothetical protein
VLGISGNSIGVFEYAHYDEKTKFTMTPDYEAHDKYYEDMKLVYGM